jgi:hypothetical protein
VEWEGKGLVVSKARVDMFFSPFLKEFFLGWGRVNGGPMIKLVINKLIDNNYFHFYHMLVNVQKVELFKSPVGAGTPAQGIMCKKLNYSNPVVAS